MGITQMLAKLAVPAIRVLVVEVPGQWSTRVELEDQMLRRGWRRAWSPADADVLAVCGVPGPELTQLVDRLWEQMPGPRVHADMPSTSTVSSALDDAITLYIDTTHHKHDASSRPQEPQLPHDDTDHGSDDAMSHSSHDTMDDDHGGMDHDSHTDMDHNGHGHMGHSDHADIDDSGHGGMDHSDHGDMEMSPGGIPLAQGGPDRDGLEMDVLHLTLGPILAYWPAGLAMNCTLQGDVVVDSDASIVDGHTSPVPAPGLSPAMRCDNVMSLLALAGADDLAARARQTRDHLLRGDHSEAHDGLERLHRAIRRSWLLRGSLRRVLVLDHLECQRYGLPASCRGDAYDRMLRTLTRIQVAVDGGGPTVDDDVSWQVLPDLVIGLELATLRLGVASVNLQPLPAHGVAHD